MALRTTIRVEVRDLLTKCKNERQTFCVYSLPTSVVVEFFY